MLGSQCLNHMTEKLLRATMKQIGPIVEPTISDYDMIQGLITPLRQYLQTKKYMVVFDDVWDTNFWEVMKHAFSSNDKGSRIIMTTRKATVAAICKGTPSDFSLKLEPWSTNMAWELFCKKTFRNEFESQCPEDIKELSHIIVRKCQGLPLAIGATSGLLSRKKKEQFEWRRVLDNVNFEFKTNPQFTRVSKIISLSYHDLPYHLKSCLLYFSTFPEDFFIFSERLFQLWIAEGFVKASDVKTLMEEAEGYLNELVKRNLVSLEILHGVFTGCKMHGLMHEFILSKANDLCFCQILDGKKSELREDKLRRLSIHGSMLKTVSESSKLNSGVRSIFLFNYNDDELINTSSLNSLFGNFRLLKLLDFQFAPLDNLPKEVGNLFHLGYLNLQGTKIKELPKSIGKLRNLQVLNLAYTSLCLLPKSIGQLHKLQDLNLFLTFVRELPMEINKLLNLRHLSASCKNNTNSCWVPYSTGVKIHKGFRYLENLETLQDVEVQIDWAVFMRELENLSKLKSLGVSNLSEASARAISAATKKLSHLEYLSMETRDVGDEILEVEPISSSPPPLLRVLYLGGRLNKFPHWISELSNLQGLMLYFSKLTDDPLKYLRDLPNLTCLRLFKYSYDGEQLHFEAGGFPKLNQLWLVALKGLKLMKIDKGTMPLLKTLKIKSCPLLEEVPSGIQYLRRLEELSIVNMPSEFVVRMHSRMGSQIIPNFNMYQYSIYNEKFSKTSSMKLGEILAHI